MDDVHSGRLDTIQYETMIENSGVEHLSANPKSDEKALNIVTFLNHSQFILQDLSVDSTSGSAVFIETPVNTEEFQNQRSIYVCTFCQVFSSSDTALVAHITEAHASSLPSGTKAENFVSKLQALQNQNKTRCSKKVGRPRKVSKESPISIDEKVLIPEPIPRPDGLYWCKKCVRYFKKARQLSRHVCLEVREEESSDELSADSDTTSDYRTYVDIEPSPWIRKSKDRNNPIKKKSLDSQELSIETQGENNTLIGEDQHSKVKPNWRDDPDYIPLFQNESDRIAFEEHLKTVDYSCVDNLFVREEKKIKGKRKKNGLHISASIYSCILCKKALNSLTHIRMHCLTHTDVKPFTCPTCPYRCNTKGSLYTHMRNHTGNMFHCSQCNFQTTKRAHLLDHEATHSKVVQLCKLCKNSYKTVRSLIYHIKRYHNNPGGKRYIKTLSSKQVKATSIKCKNCLKKFRSQADLENHNKMEHIITLNPLQIESLVEDSGKLQDTVSERMLNVPAANCNDGYPNDILAIKDPLAEIVLNNLLQQNNTQPIELYEDMFQESTTPNLLRPSRPLTGNFSSDSPSQRIISPINVTNQFHSPKTVLEDCAKTINLDIIDECLRNPNFASEVINEACIQTSNLSNECNQSFNLPAMQLAFPDDSLIPADIVENDKLSKDLSQLNPDLVDKNDLTEPKSAEIKLFEKCRRAPAYVCCVCSGIYICPSTLKAHLKEHINTSSSLMEQTEDEFEQTRMSETDAAIDNVCRILQDPADACSDDEKELEKLYTSSLDMMWYLPEVSVVLENDPALFDAVLDDISNFPIPDKFDESEDLQVKCSDMFN